MHVIRICKLLLSVLSKRANVIVLAGFLVCLGCFPSFGQGTITFDGFPYQPPGTAYSMSEYYESGMAFLPMNQSFGRVTPGTGTENFAHNGTAFLNSALGDSLMFTSINSEPFSLHSVDLAEYSTVVPNARTVTFYGFRFDGTMVSHAFTTDGIIDGIGPLVDFQTFYFGSEFTDLQRVEIRSFGWSMDNLVVVPEPGVTVFLLVGTLSFWLLRKVRSGDRNMLS